MPESLTRAQWREIAIAGYGPTLMASIGMGAVTPLIALSARHLGASVGLAAFIVGLMAVGTLIGDLPAGVVASSWGEKKAITAACLVSAVALAGACVAHSVPVLMIAVFVLGLAGSVFGVARQSFLTEAVPVRYRGRAMSTLGGTFRVGFFLGPLAGAAIVSRWGLAPAYGFAAIMELVAAVVTLTLPDVTKEAPADADAPTILTTLRDNRRVLLTIGLGCLALMIVRQTRQAVLPLWCEAHGIDAAATSLIFSASMFLDVLLFLPGGWLMDKVGRWWLCVPSMLVMATGLVVLPFTTTLPTIAAVAMVLGLGNGVSSGIVMTLASDASPAIGRPQFLASFRLFSDAGVMLAPLLITAITTVAPLSSAAFALGGIGFVGAAWLTKWVPRNRPA